MRESHIEAHLVRLAKAKGALTFKFTSAVAGVPDRAVIHRGKTYWVEVKRPDGVLSKIQEFTHDEMSKRGVEPYVLWSLDDVEHFVEGL